MGCPQGFHIAKRIDAVDFAHPTGSILCISQGIGGSCRGATCVSGAVVIAGSSIAGPDVEKTIRAECELAAVVIELGFVERQQNALACRIRLIGTGR
jgi:hypothetical protein